LYAQASGAAGTAIKINGDVAIDIVAGTIDGDLTPDNDGTQDLGTSSAHWDNMYIGGSLYFDDTASLQPETNQYVQIGTTSRRFGKLFVLEPNLYKAIDNCGSSTTPAASYAGGGVKGRLKFFNASGTDITNTVTGNSDGYVQYSFYTA